MTVSVKNCVTFWICGVLNDSYGTGSGLLTSDKSSDLLCIKGKLRPPLKTKPKTLPAYLVQIQFSSQYAESSPTEGVEEYCNIRNT